MQRLASYCAEDVLTSRAAWRHPKLKPLIESERRIQIIDAVINRRGVRADRELATAARDMAAHERYALNTALHDLTKGAITSVDQTKKILAFAVARGHAMTSVGRRSVSAVLTAEPDEETRTVLELRRDGARASVRKYESILAYACEADDRMLEPPAWAAGLPLAGKVWSGTHYLEPPEETLTPSNGNGRDESDQLIEELIAETPFPAQAEAEAEAEAETADALADDTVAPLFDLVGVPLSDNHTTQCPFHPDEEPSLTFYADHFHCFGCGEHGDRVDWLTRGEGLSREEAVALIKDWDGPKVRQRPVADKASSIAYALSLWSEARSIRGTAAERYLAETRGINLAALPAAIDDSLRFDRTARSIAVAIPACSP